MIQEVIITDSCFRDLTKSTKRSLQSSKRPFGINRLLWEYITKPFFTKDQRYLLKTQGMRELVHKVYYPIAIKQQMSSLEPQETYKAFKGYSASCNNRKSPAWDECGKIIDSDRFHLHISMNIGQLERFVVQCDYKMVELSGRRCGQSFGSRGQIYNNCMMANYERLTQLLAKMHQSEHVRAVQSELNHISEDPLVVNLMAMAIADPNLPHNSKLAAAVALNRTINEHFHDFQEPAMIEQLMRVFFDFSVDFKYKHALQNAFVSLLEMSDSDIIQDLFKAIGQVLHGVNTAALVANQNSMEEQTGDHTLQLKKIQIVFYVYKCILDAGNHLGRLFEEVQEELQVLLSLVPISPDPEHIATLYRMADFFAALMEKLNQNTNTSLQKCAGWLCNQNTLLRWIFCIYDIKGTKGQCWLSFEPEKNPSQLNDLKTRTGQLQLGILSYLHSQEMGESAIIDKQMQASQILLNTLSVYAGCHRALFPFESFVTVQVKCMTMLYLLRRTVFKPLYSTLLHQAIFPLLTAKDEEIKLFDEDPEEFNRIAEDCCDHQRFGILKTDAAHLLQSICDQDQEASAYVVRHCIMSLKVRLSLDESYESQAPNFLPIETALLALAIHSYKISNFQGQLLELRRILSFQVIKGRLSGLELTRLFAFLAYNYNQLYKDGNEGEEWVRLALVSDQHPTVEMAALDFITNIVEDYFSIAFIRDFAQRSLVKGNMHLNALLKMITTHMSKISQADMIPLAEILIKIIARDVQKYLKREISHTMDIVNCLHMMRKLIDKENYLYDKPILAQKLWGVVELMPALQQAKIEDELVRIITSFVNRESTLSPQIIAALQIIIRMYQLERQDSTAYLVFFNQVIMKGAASIAAHVATILIPAFLSIKDQVGEQRITKWKVAIATICIILQNILAFHGNDIPAPLIQQLAVLALTIIPPDDSPEDKYDNVLVARGLNLLFLCHMNQKKDVALRRLLMFQDTHIFDSYDLRVLCLCLGKEIMREADVVAVTEMINLMVKAISSSKAKPPAIIPKKNPFSVKSSSTKIRIKRIEDYEYILKFLVTPFRESQPEAELQKVIDTMKHNNPYLYQGIIKSLPRFVYESLKEQMSEVTVEGKKRRIVHAGAMKEDGKLPNETVAGKGVKKRTLASESEQPQDEQDEHLESKRRNMKKKKLKDEVKGRDMTQ